MEKKNIIFVGRAGAGKSTVANMLCTGSIHTPFKTGSSAKGVTLHCQVDNKSNSEWNVFDTVGLGEIDEGSVSNENAINTVKSFVKATCVKFNYVCFVMPKDRITIQDESIFLVAKEIFKGDLQQNFVLIVTKVDSEDDKNWLEDNIMHIEDSFDRIPVIDLNFPPVSNKEDREKDNIKERNDSIIRLIAFLNTYNYPPAEHEPVKIETFMQYLRFLLDCMKRGWNLGKMGTKGLRYRKNQPPIIYRGTRVN